MAHPVRLAALGGLGVLATLVLGARCEEPAPAASGLFRQLCASCHGADGRASRGRRSHPDIPDFTQPAWHARRSNARLLTSILEGKGDEMPSFNGQLSRAQARELVAYLRTFADQGRAPEQNSAEFEKEFHKLRTNLNELRKLYTDLTAEASKQPAEVPAQARK